MFSTSLLLLLATASYVHSYELTQPADMTVQPGQSLSIPCKTSYSVTSEHTAWIRQPAGKTLEWIGYISSSGRTSYSDKLKNKFSISRDIFTNTITIQGQNLQTEDTAVYYCAKPCGGAFDYWGKGTSVTVTSATQEAPKSLFPVWQCGSSPDGFVTLGCVTRDLATPDGLSYVWKDASGTALTTNVVQYPAVSEGGKYSSVSQARVSANDWNANKLFTCEVTNPQGTKTAQLKKPEVTETPPNISISTSFDTTTNDTNLICWLDGFSPKGINVDWGAGKKGTEKKFQNEGKKEFAVLSQISINAQQWKEGKEFTCSATHKTKTVSQTWSICKGHPISEPRIRLEKPPLRSILTDTHVTVSCLVETVFQPTISWQVDESQKSGTYIKSERQGESTVSNLTIPVEEWTKSNTITCRAEHPCFKTIEDQIKRTENVQKRPSDLRPTVEIRRSLADIGKRDSAVLECVASGLPSGELSVTFQANDEKFPEAQYVNLPEGQDTLVAPFTIPGTHRTKSYSFTCQIQLSRFLKWKSNSTGNLFSDPLVELSVVSSEDKSASTAQKLLCYGTGLNPVIKWLPESVGNADSEVTMNADGRVKVSSELSVTEQEWNRGTTFTCQVRDQGGLKTVQKNISFCAVTPDHARNAQVYLLGPSISNISEEDPVSVTCLLLGHRLQDFSVNCQVGTDNLSSNVIKTEYHGNGTEGVQRVLRVPAGKWKNHEKVSCEVKHPCTNAQTYSTSKTKDLAATLLLTTPTQTELDSGTAMFICLASDFFPKSHTFKWTHGMTNLENKVKRTILSKENDTFTAMSILELTANEWIGSSSPVKCEFQHTAQNLSKESSYVLVDQQLPKVTIIPPSNEDILINRTGDLMCKAEGSKGFTGIKWFVNGKETAALPKDDVSGMTAITLTTQISYEEWTSGTKFTCEVYHSAFAQGFIKEDYRRQHGDRKCPEVYLLAPSESSGGNSVTLTCYVKEFYPQEVAVSWLVNDKQVDDVVSFKQNTTNVIERDNHFSAYSQLIVNPAAWTNGSVFTCNVYHESIADPVRHISRSIAINSNPPTLVNLSLNVPQSCAAPVLY